VTLVAATQRPTQKVMGQGAVRSQMNIRIAFRVEEQRDVDLILGQGKLKAGWHAHKLNAPGKFLVSAPEHDTPRRARAYLVTDDDVTQTAARYAASRPVLDEVSLRAIRAASDPPENTDDRVGSPPEPATAEDALWSALCMAPDEGTEVGVLLTLTGLSRPTLYRHLREHAQAGRAIQVSRGRWRARSTDRPSQ